MTYIGKFVGLLGQIANRLLENVIWYTISRLSSKGRAKAYARLDELLAEQEKHE